MSRRILSLLILVTLLAAAGPARADLILGPAPFDTEAAGLAPGDTYHVMFATSQTFGLTSDRSIPPPGGKFGGIEAASWQTTLMAAQAGLIEDWDLEQVVYRAVLSDDTADARDHIDISGPVFNTQGEKLADDFDDFFDGSVDTPIAYDEHGDLITSTQERVWSGNQPSGTATSSTCGNWDDPLAGSATGGSYSSTSWHSGPDVECSSSARLMGVSPALQVQPVPEPSGWALSCIGIAVCGLFLGIRKLPQVWWPQVKGENG